MWGPDLLQSFEPQEKGRNANVGVTGHGVTTRMLCEMAHEKLGQGRKN